MLMKLTPADTNEKDVNYERRPKLKKISKIIFLEQRIVHKHFHKDFEF